MNKGVDRVEAEGLVAPAGQVRQLILADRDLFGRRAKRFRQLAPGHPLESYFTFLGLLAEAQQQALQNFPPLPSLALAEQALCREHGLPLLATESWCRNPAWRTALTMILQQLETAALPAATRSTIAALQQSSAAELELLADQILAGELAKVSPQQLPLVAAALQVYWLQMATSLGEEAFAGLEPGGVCPVCGSLPGAGLVNGVAAPGSGLRYLSCSLCASEWHMVRIKCSDCASTQGINHYTLEGSNAAVKAESCDSCNSYLKLLYLEKDAQLEALADDLATLPLDLLMTEAGKSRRGPNLFFHPGAAD